MMYTRIRQRSTAAAGFGLIELIVALAIFSVGILSLAAAAATAQRAFASADAIERAAYIAAAVIDSLGREPAPVAGEHIVPGAVARWSVETDSAVHRLTVDVEVTDGRRTMRFDFRGVHVREGPP